MKIVPFRIPKQVVLPGLVVQVRTAPTKEIEGNTGLWLYNEDGTALILLNASKSLAVQRYTLLHELQHVMTDYVDQALERYGRFIRTGAMARAAKRKRVSR